MAAKSFRSLLPDFVSAMKRNGIADAQWGTTGRNGTFVAYGHLPDGRAVAYRFALEASPMAHFGDLLDRVLTLGRVETRTFSLAQMEAYIAQAERPQSTPSISGVA
jgi:hypothetical protein